MLRFVWLNAAAPEVKECYALRQTVFVEEQGFKEEFDDLDARCEHLLALEGNMPVATARLYREGESYHVGRICVCREKRGSGLGRMLLNEVEIHCVQKGGNRLVLGAQTRAEGFYSACGYKRFGSEYYEEYCPHVMMEKKLS